ncbi:unnamed protein product (macronuclear) [Paramecium tetraurelia]|uniref:Tyrosine-protein phosphatase domain-containing protein n=1 Tax=Paramecium tetraurelia TaxID=5888 RepID=A0CIP2_PARTE|nr:uncharacterized protein GSPATT00007794001 [Paramecium tetraurelia]CAK70659.1 unnamed protein product [Paramecium tetraurelia]|eukprot:XP_001438056.1 hypothetical protein (macronuclear) [Paramecium tetraurelia strain d4-2]
MFNSSLNLRQISKIIASRILDGVFIGNYQPLQEQQYMKINQITHVVNCAAAEIQVPENLSALNYYWKDQDSQTIVTIETIREIQTFVEKALKRGESVLFCCVNGQSRSLTALVSYLMLRYSWSLFKALQYINIQQKEFEIRSTFLKQLIVFEKEQLKGKVISRNWNQTPLDREELLLQNTYLNSVQKEKDDQLINSIPKSPIIFKRKSISWQEKQIALSNLDICQNFSKEKKFNKSILKPSNFSKSELNNSQSKAQASTTLQKPKSKNEELFIRKNSQYNRNNQLRTLTPLKKGKIFDSITPRLPMRKYLEIELQSSQYQQRFRSQTTTPRCNQNFRNQNASYISVDVDQESSKRNPHLIRRAQFKLSQLL